MTNNLQIYQASAGSGKTRTLVKEYLILAFKNPGNYKHILAITFTNKATEEMKTRVIDYLVKLSEGGEQQLAKEIISEMKQRGYANNNFDIRGTASQVLSSILHDYSSFNISTIDSFCVRIIKAFAKELGLPVGFKLELDTDKVIDEITSNMLDSLNSDKDLNYYVTEFLQSSINDEKSWNIESYIREFGKQIISENFWLRKLNNPDDVYDDKNKVLDLISDIEKVIYTFENHIKESAKKIINKLKSEGISYDSLVGGKVSSILKYCENLLIAPKEPPVILVSNYIEGKSFFKTPSPVEKDIMLIYEDIIHMIDNNFKSYNTAKTIFKTIYSIGILGDLLKFLSLYRKENRTILSTDVNNFLRFLISDDISPFIFEKIGVNLEYFMLDEFQDTSRFQWDNLKPLIINSLSENNHSLIVGDVKQSIYRWRNGDMRLLLYGVKRDLNAFSGLIKEESLKTNWRSREEIVNFNNRFFMILKNQFDSADGSSNDYLIQSYDENLAVQENSGKNPGGFVEVNFFEEDKNSDISSNVLSENRVVEIIKEALNDNYKPGDILVLVYTSKESIYISQAITKGGFSVVSEQSLLLKSSAKVNFIISVLKYLNDSHDRLARTEMLYSFSQIKNAGVDSVAIFNDSIEKVGKIFFQLMPDEFFKEDEKPKRLPVLYNLTIYELVEHITSIFDLNIDADAYIIKFLDEVNRFALDKESDINSFIDYWGDNKEKLSISVPENSNSVRVMTIHKSKGLESKIVIIPYANWGVDIDGGRDKIWASTDKSPFNKASVYFIKATKDVTNTYFDGDYTEEAKMVRLDNINLLYVSMTRPKDRLYLNVPLKSKSSIANLIKSAVEQSYEIKNNRLLLGIKQKLEIKNDSEISINVGYTRFERFYSSPYFKKIFIRPSYRKLKIFENERMRIKTDNGVVVHKLLSYIITKEDVYIAINKGLIEGIISLSEKDKFKALLKKTIESEETKNWFDGSFDVKSECEILTADNRLLRPDRVMIAKDRAIIIDYKTGREEVKHSEQLNEYAKILSEMGYNKIEKYLLYINDYKDEVIIKVNHLNGGKNE